MARPAKIVIDNWQKGMGTSPHTGFADIRNCIINLEEGVVEIGYITSLEAGTAVIGDKVNWFTQDSSTPAQYFSVDDSGVIYRSTDSGGTWAQAADQAGGGELLEIWKDHLFFSTGSGGVGIFGPLSGTEEWATSFITLDDGSGDLIPTLVGQDDILYFGDGKFVASIQEVPGQTFSSAAATYTFNSQALDIPDGRKINALAEHGKNLMVGTFGTASAESIKVADIFPWDRTSDSFFLPIRVNENGINAMETIDNLVYFHAGAEGALYATDGTSTDEVTRVPAHAVGLLGANRIDVKPAAIMRHKNKVYFGVSSSGSSGQEITSGVGVWSYEVDTGALMLENIISTGSDGDSAPNDVQITAIHPVDRNQYLIAWTDGADDAIDLVTTNRYTNYAARIDSPYFPLGSLRQPEMITELEFELSEPLTTGEGIRFFHRTDTDSDFTEIRTFDFATDGGIQKGIAYFPIVLDDGIQIRIEMTTGSSSTTTPKLRAVTLR